MHGSLQAETLGLPSPGKVLGESVAAVTSFAGTSGAISGRFSERSGGSPGDRQDVSISRLTFAFDLPTIESGVFKGLMPLENGLFVRLNPMLHLGHTRIDANFDQLPNANEYYRLLNGTYTNTSIRSASLSTEIAVGKQLPIKQPTFGRDS